MGCAASPGPPAGRFNPRPPREGRREAPGRQGAGDVSSPPRPPREGRPVGDPSSPALTSTVSIRAPRARGDYPPAGCAPRATLGLFQSAPPARGATPATGSPGRKAWFQSCSPREGRRMTTVPHSTSGNGFTRRPPREGRLCEPREGWGARRRFYCAPRARGDRPSGSDPQPGRGFNPRPPREGRLARPGPPGRPDRSIRAPRARPRDVERRDRDRHRVSIRSRARGDRVRRERAPLARRFHSRPPCEGRPPTVPACSPERRHVSILCPPAPGATGLAAWPALPARDRFNPRPPREGRLEVVTLSSPPAASRFNPRPPAWARGDEDAP